MEVHEARTWEEHRVRTDHHLHFNPKFHLRNGTSDKILDSINSIAPIVSVSDRPTYENRKEWKS